MKLKTIVGIGLIVLSIAAMFVWEGFGREKLTTESILVCAEDMEKGDAVTAEKLRVRSIPKDNILEGTLRPGDEALILGLSADQDLSRGQQLKAEYFSSHVKQMGKGKSIFVLPSEWIFSRSSALRSGDEVSIYSLPSKTLLGKFEVAFVRDASEQEVRGLDRDGGSVLERSDSGRIISDIEIVCSLQEYYRIYDSVMAVRDAALVEEDEYEYVAYGEADYNCLLIVMEDAV